MKYYTNIHNKLELRVAYSQIKDVDPANVQVVYDCGTYFSLETNKLPEYWRRIPSMDHDSYVVGLISPKQIHTGHSDHHIVRTGVMA